MLGNYNLQDLDEQYTFNDLLTLLDKVIMCGDK